MGYEWNKEVIMMIYFDKIDKNGDMYKSIGLDIGELF